MFEDFYPISQDFFEILRAWWWFPLPFVFIRPFLNSWLWWKRTAWYKDIDWVLLEIKVPTEQAKTPEAMETVLSGLTAIYGGPNRREKWVDGEFNLWLSLEIAGINGVPHFYIRFPKQFRNLVESNVYSQYPDAEIFEAEDYTRNVPQDIPNKEWKMWGRDMILKNDQPYPVRTYKEFAPSKEKEEKIVDPVANLLEGIGKLKKGEQMWIQFLIRPITSEERDLKKEGKNIVDEIVGRPIKSETRPIILEAAKLLLKGPPKKGEKEGFPGAMKLTEREKDIIKAIQRKIGKHYFQTAIRVIYLAKEDVYLGANAGIIGGFFLSFSTLDLNRFGSLKETKPKVQWVLRNQRNYARKRRMFWLYTLRFPPLCDTSDFWSIEHGTSILNIEEVASMFHFPSRVVAPAPTMERIEARKGGPPPELPTE